MTSENDSEKDSRERTERLPKFVHEGGYVRCLPNAVILDGCFDRHQIQHILAALTEGQGPAKVYLVVLDDRYDNVKTEVYAGKDKALARAKQIALDCGCPETATDVDECQAAAGWLYDSYLSNEGDHVHVEEQKVMP